MIYLFRSYDGYIFHTHANSKYGHYFISLANDEGHPLATGGYSDYTNKAETYDYTTNTWTEVAVSPYQD